MLDAGRWERIDPAGPDVWAQVSHAREHEWAATAEDIVHTRTTLAVRGLDTPAVREQITAELDSFGMSALIAAHRGASARLDDNSLEAFEAAIALGADLIETDVRADDGGNLILAHDRVRPDDPTPVMLDQLVALAAGRIALNLELKQHGLEQRLLAALQPRPDGLLVSSFLPEALREVRRLDPTVDTGLVVQIGREPFAVAAECGAQALIANVKMIDDALLQAAALHGARTVGVDGQRCRRAEVAPGRARGHRRHHRRARAGPAVA